MQIWKIFKNGDQFSTRIIKRGHLLGLNAEVYSSITTTIKGQN